MFWKSITAYLALPEHLQLVTAGDQAMSKMDIQTLICQNSATEKQPLSKAYTAPSMTTSKLSILV